MVLFFRNPKPSTERISSYERPGIQMGMSYEMADAYAENMKVSVWKLSESGIYRRCFEK